MSDLRLCGTICYCAGCLTRRLGCPESLAWLLESLVRVAPSVCQLWQLSVPLALNDLVAVERLRCHIKHLIRSYLCVPMPSNVCAAMSDEGVALAIDFPHNILCHVVAHIANLYSAIRVRSCRVAHLQK